MRVLLQTRPDHRSRLGGDRIVIEALSDYLTARGFHVGLSPEATPALEPYDAVHLFNLELLPHTFLQAEHARRHGRPYIITPIYWPPKQSAPWQAYAPTSQIARRFLPERVIDALSLTNAFRRTGTDLRALRKLPSLSRHRLRAIVLAGAAAVMASCEAERQFLLRDFPAVEPHRVHVAKFGYRRPAPAAPTAPMPPPGYFLCVGAIGPRKNQLSFVRALRGIPGARAVFIGGAAVGCQGYYRAVASAAPAGSVFLPDQPHGVLPLFYRDARVVVQPSFIELPGLVAMEAVANQRPVVAADRPPVRAYLEGLVTFADPVSVESLRYACQTATVPHPTLVATFIASHDWSVTTQPLDAVYDALAC